MEHVSYKEFDQITEKVFSELEKACNWNENIRQKFCDLTNFLLSENEKYNLTAIRNVEGVIKNHLFDSVSIADLIPEGVKVIDVGAGAGFPSLPLAIVRPDLRIIALDSTGKKTEFTKAAAKLLDLHNIDAMSARAEELVSDLPTFREHFDVAVARSVAALPILSELCLPFVKVGGMLVAMKSESAAHELAESKNAFRLLGGEAKSVTLYQSREDEVRCAFVISKIAQTPDKYPRAYAQIKKKPL